MVPSPNDVLTLSIIPLVALIGSFTLVAVIVLVVEYGRRTRNRMIHEERMAAIEKGLPVPPPFLEGIRKPNYVMRGLVLIALGIGFCIWTLSDADFPVGIGAILFFMGLAILIAYSLTERRRKESYSSGSIVPLWIIRREMEASAFASTEGRVNDQPSHKH